MENKGPHLLPNAHNQLYSHRYENEVGNSKLRHCPASKSALSGMVSSSCLCSPTACNESSVSEPWHAQMINWWQRELIKEIKLGTQPPQCSTCTCITRASSREGIIHHCQSFLSWFLHRVHARFLECRGQKMWTLKYTWPALLFCSFQYLLWIRGFPKSKYNYQIGM